MTENKRYFPDILSGSDAHSHFTVSLIYSISYVFHNLPSQVSYSLRRLTAFQTQNLYIGPQSESELSHIKAPDLKSLCPGSEAKPDPIKGGLRVTSFFTYNCLTVSLSDNLEKHSLKVTKR